MKKMHATALLLTAAIALGAIAFHLSYPWVQGPVEGSAAVAQLNGGDAQYVAGQAVAHGAVTRLVDFYSAAVVAATWLIVGAMSLARGKKAFEPSKAGN